MTLRSETNLFDPMLVPERLAYPSSSLGYEFSCLSRPVIDLTVDVELVRRVNSGRSCIALFLLPKLPPYRLDPGATDDENPPQPLPSWELPHCHAMSGPLFPPSAISAMCRGGGSGGGTGSLAFGIDIGPGAEGEDAEVYELDLLEFRNRSEGLESCT